MKKLFALLLVLATLIPMGTVAFAEDNTPAPVADPYYLINWDVLDDGTFDNIFAAPCLWVGESTYPTISWGSDAKTPKAVAAKVKARFDTRPAGTRYVHFGFATRVYLMYNQENYIYFDKGIELLHPWLTEFLTELKGLGGELDGMFLDTEITSMGSYYLHREAAKNPLVYQQIVSDPRYATEVRPLLVERGFPFHENPTEYMPEIYTISFNLTGEENDTARAIWDSVMGNRMSAYLDKAVYSVLQQFYPDAQLSDYQSHELDSWYKGMSDLGGIIGSNTSKVGTTSNHNVYHSRPHDRFYRNADNDYIYQKPSGYNGVIYEKTAFHMALWEVNHFKYIYASDENNAISAWLTSYNYGEKPLAYSPYVTEIVYHLGLLNPTPFLAYIIQGEVPTVSYHDRLKVVSQQLHELTRLVGYSDRKVLEVPANWNEGFMLSGMYANGRNVWRLTPDTTQVELKDFRIDGADPTFRINGKTITFPGGKIVEDAKIDDIGSCGFWIETPKDVTPIVITESNRFAKYPSLNITFDTCADGKFDFNNCDPLGAWEFKWNKKTDSATTIVANGDGKALSVNGDVTLKSIKLPGNVSAGDTYAEDQAWEITVTIPEGMAAEAVINLLSYAGSSQKVDDGGFKIEGGKVYYSQLGEANEEGKAALEYAELSAIAAGTYTFKRVMNFTYADKFTSTYYVYGADGTLLGSSEEVDVPVFKDITSINFVTKAADKAILLDNYKITLTGKATDFGLYDVNTGAPVNKESIISASTAYRLSWLNATGSTQTATVMVAIYQGDVLQEEKAIKEVQMNPGCDGIETGIVEVAEGQSVKIFLRTSNNRAPDLSDSKSNPIIRVITLIAVGIVMIAAAVIALLSGKHKKALSKQAEEDA